MKPDIGFVGIGAMGAPMAQNLIKEGYRLVAYDIKYSAVETLVKSGAEPAFSVKDLAHRCPVVITMLPASPAVEAVILGSQGVIEGAKAGNIVIDMSSSFPTSTRMISEQLAAKGIRMIDAPVSGGTRGAREASLTIMVGGNEGDFEECRPILESMGKRIFYLGKIGAGHTVKAFNNLCSACSMVITSEVVIAATNLGLSPEKVLSVINSSSGRSWSSEFKFPNYVLNDRFDSGFSISLMNKDLEIATRLAAEINVPMPVGAMVQRVYDDAVDRGGGNECHTAIIKYLEGYTARSS